MTLIASRLSKLFLLVLIKNVAIASRRTNPHWISVPILIFKCGTFCPLDLKIFFSSQGVKLRFFGTLRINETLCKTRNFYFLKSSHQLLLCLASLTIELTKPSHISTENRNICTNLKVLHLKNTLLRHFRKNATLKQNAALTFSKILLRSSHRLLLNLPYWQLSTLNYPPIF